MKLSIYPFAILFLLFASCSGDDDVFDPRIQNPGNGNGACSFGGDWLIPRSNVFDGGPGCDGIPSLDNARFADQLSINFLTENSLLLAADDGLGKVKLYPHNILDWHEIINDEVDNQALAIVYCPLTGTGIGWDRTFGGETTSFGVSGLLYNTNIIPYDRKTGSNWSQQRMECVNGERAGETPATTNLVEVRWKDVSELFPNATVVSEQTGLSRNYTAYPYGDYRTNDNSIIFPIDTPDDRLPNKERVMGVIIDGEAKAYRFGSFSPNGWSLINDTFAGRELLVVGSQNPETMAVFDRELPDGTLLDLRLIDTDNTEFLTDQEGNVWDIFGRHLRGPRFGQRLNTPTAMMGYWFSWGTFYPGLEVFGE